MHRFAHAALFVAGVSAAVVAGPLLDHSMTSVTADGQGSHTVTTTITGTTTQSGIADRSGHTTVDRLDGPPVTISGQVDPEAGQGTGHFVNTIFGDVCNGQCPKP
jgi:hypothetical protein